MLLWLPLPCQSYNCRLYELSLINIIWEIKLRATTTTNITTTITTTTTTTTSIPSWLALQSAWKFTTEESFIYSFICSIGSYSVPNVCWSRMTQLPEILANIPKSSFCCFLKNQDSGNHLRWCPCFHITSLLRIFHGFPHCKWRPKSIPHSPMWHSPVSSRLLPWGQLHPYPLYSNSPKVLYFLYL